MHKPFAPNLDMAQRARALACTEEELQQAFAEPTPLHPMVDPGSADCETGLESALPDFDPSPQAIETEELIAS